MTSRKTAGPHSLAPQHSHRALALIGAESTRDHFVEAPDDTLIDLPLGVNSAEL